MDKNLGDQSRICMMLGYIHQTTKIWRIWDFATNKAIEASNALFYEEVNANTGQTVTQDEFMRLFPEIEDTDTSNKNPSSVRERKRREIKGQ
jgi:hypothetical protein